jgi:tryptophanyl-tRNA synthetase
MKNKKRILTGDRPTSRLHIGHYAGSLENRVKLQNEYEQFIIIADIQALTTHFKSPEILKQNVMDLCIDYLSVGIDIEKSNIFVQSMVPQISELTTIYSMFITVNLLKHNPTIKTEAVQYGYKDLYYGFLGYPISQAADITFCNSDLVPVGEDQLPVIEVTKKIVNKFNSLYKPVLKEPSTLLSECPRLKGIDGKSKMSKSIGNAIYLSDEKDIVYNKIMSSVTDPQRIKLHDKGHPEICTVAEYHKIFNNKEYDNICSMCKEAAIGCTTCKKDLAETLDEFLLPIREKRKSYENKLDIIKEILQNGSAKARTEGQKTLEKVKESIQINYF